MISEKTSLNRYEEVTIERRHAGQSTPTTATKGPVQSHEEVNIPFKKIIAPKELLILDEGYMGSLLFLQITLMSFLGITIVAAIDSTEAL